MTMWTAIAGFFLDTRLGQSILLAVAITAAVVGTYCYIDGKAYDRGFGEAQRACEQEQSAAKTDLLNDRADQAKAGSDLAAKTDAAGEKAASETATQTQRDKDKNHDDYAKQKPVPGACTPVPLPAGVQDRIDAAVR